MDYLQHLPLILLLGMSIMYSQNSFGQTKEFKELQIAKIYERIGVLKNAFESGDGESFVEIFSDKMYPKDVKIQIAKSVQEAPLQFEIVYEIYVDELKVDQMMAFESGWFRTTMTAKSGGDPIIQEFEFLDIWEMEEDGLWRITKAIKTEREERSDEESMLQTTDYGQYIGSYKAEAGTLQISFNENEKLILSPPGQPDIQLIEISSEKFKLSGIPGAELIFSSDKNGKVLSFTLVQMSGEFEAVKQ